MSLKKVYTHARVIETLENYSLADNLTAKPGPLADHREDSRPFFYTDEDFWTKILADPNSYWNGRMEIFGVTVSKWIARVPGLFWSEGSMAIRQTAESQVAKRNQKWVEYYPPGKSSKVAGGVGTFILPSNDEYVLMTAACSCNASVGIPVLFSKEVLKKHKIEEGTTMALQDVSWTKMSTEWAQHFPSVKGIPRGYLFVDRPAQVKVLGKENFVEFHPFSVMEYEKNGGLFYDFVYRTVDNTDGDYRPVLEEFFEYYRNRHGSQGRYLVAVDMNFPIFEAVYNTAEELRRDVNGETQLRLITNRIRQHLINGQEIDDLISYITRKYYTLDSVQALAVQVGIKPGFLGGNNAATMINQLVAQLYETKKIDILVDAVSMKHPDILTL